MITMFDVYVMDKFNLSAIALAMFVDDALFPPSIERNHVKCNGDLEEKWKNGKKLPK